MKKINVVPGESIKVIHKTQDGRIAIIEGELFKKTKRHLVLNSFKKRVYSLKNEVYDLLDFTPSKVEITKNSIQSAYRLKHKPRTCIDSFDDGEY